MPSLSSSYLHKRCNFCSVGGSFSAGGASAGVTAESCRGDHGRKQEVGPDERPAVRVGLRSGHSVLEGAGGALLQVGD